jgi:agmatinase
MGEARASEPPEGPVDASLVPRFAGPATFGRLPRLDQVERCAIAVVGVPFDSGTSYRPGARFGPTAIREASRLLRPYNPGLNVAPFALQQVADAGDIACNPFDIAEAIVSIERGATALAHQGCRLVALGGDHTIALPLLRVAADRHGRVALVHFDAHLDTWDTYFGAPYTHGTPFRRAFEEGLLDPDRVCHVGLRGPLYSSQDLEDDSQMGFRRITAEDVMERGVSPIAQELLAHVGDGPVYISVDIDVLDPAHAPGTGTPEPGGLATRELLALLRRFAMTQVIGADVVEVSPAFDHAELTALAAAHVAYELVTVMTLPAPAP